MCHAEPSQLTKEVRWWPTTTFRSGETHLVHFDVLLIDFTFIQLKWCAPKWLVCCTWARESPELSLLKVPNNSTGEFIIRRELKKLQHLLTDTESPMPYIHCQIDNLLLTSFFCFVVADHFSATRSTAHLVHIRTALFLKGDAVLSCCVSVKVRGQNVLVEIYVRPPSVSRWTTPKLKKRHGWLCAHTPSSAASLHI